MKAVLFIGVITLMSTTIAPSAFAQKSKREQIVASCIAQAQDQIKPSGNPNDPGFNNRYNVYATCMRGRGQRP